MDCCWYWAWLDQNESYSKLQEKLEEGLKLLHSKAKS
jgi:hypothetical protein